MTFGGRLLFWLIAGGCHEHTEGRHGVDGGRDRVVGGYARIDANARGWIDFAKGEGDRRVLHLIKQWLECPAEETGKRGRKRRTTEAKDSRRGISQGSPISPLLANLYMPVRVCMEEARAGAKPWQPDRDLRRRPGSHLCSQTLSSRSCRAWEQLST